MQRHARLVPRALIHHLANKVVQLILLVEEDGDDCIDNDDDAQNQKQFDL